MSPATAANAPVSDSRIPLPAAARRLGMSWPATYAAILRGKLDAIQQPNGRWVVSVESIEQFERERDGLPAGAQ